MNIKKDYINKTKEYLKDLRMKLNKKEMLQLEVDMLKERQSIESNEVIIESKSSRSYNGIEDLIISFDSQITCKEAQVDRINHFIRMYELYTRSLGSVEKKVINLRYLESEKIISFVTIAKKLSYSKSTIANIHDETIEKLAFYIYGDEATYI